MHAAAPLPFDWRPVTPADLFVLAALYRDCALRLGPLVYTPEQVAAWASVADDEAGFRGYVLHADTWVAERPADGRVLGFCGVSRQGVLRELQSLYVTPMLTRRGLGSEMLRRTLERAGTEGARRCAAWATPFSRPVFEAAGFALARTVTEPFAGVVFERYRLERG